MLLACGDVAAVQKILFACSRVQRNDDVTDRSVCGDQGAALGPRTDSGYSQAQVPNLHRICSLAPRSFIHLVLGARRSVSASHKRNTFLGVSLSALEPYVCSPGVHPRTKVAQPRERCVRSGGVVPSLSPPLSSTWRASDVGALRWHESWELADRQRRKREHRQVRHG